MESSVGLQTLLYFNVWFSALWLIFYFLMGRWRSANLETPLAFNVMSPLVFILWLLAEPVRMYFGWSGNLEEKVPQLGTFVLLSVFPTFVSIVYFLGLAPNRMPIDYALNAVMAFFVGAEVFMAGRMIVRLVNTQTARVRTGDIELDHLRSDKRL